MTTETELRPSKTARGNAKVMAPTVDLEAAAKEKMNEFVAMLTHYTDAYIEAVNKDVKLRKQRSNGSNGASTADLASVITFPAGLPPYPWWNLVMAGPFQVLGTGANGPFAPHKIIDATEPAFMIGAIWRNPAPVNWTPPGPNPVQLMAALTMSVEFQTLNLTTGVVGPTFAPIGIPTPLNFEPVIPFYAPLSFAEPVQGVPHLYEINLVADVSGPVSGMPFAGYSTWHYDPDIEPPFLTLPPVPRSWEHDIPARILVYKA